jgi:ribosomal protein L16 Arg81 hydroxylase
VYGKKRWYITPPNMSMYSRTHPIQWLAELPDDLRFPLLHCTQSEGDIFFVPEMWAHAVVNAEDTVGYASEFLFGPGQFGMN